jgi:hypothetical protein
MELGLMRRWPSTFRRSKIGSTLQRYKEEATPRQTVKMRSLPQHRGALAAEVAEGEHHEAAVVAHQQEEVVEVANEDLCPLSWVWR